TRAYWVLDRWLIEPLLLMPLDWLMRQLSRVYAIVLRHALRHQWWVMPASLLLAAAAFLFAFGLTIPLPGWLAGDSATPGLLVKPGLAKDPSAAVVATPQPEFVLAPVGRELVPSEDQNRFIINVICPVGVSIDYVDDMLQKGENILAG